MSKPLYSAEAHVTGGRLAGHGKSADGELEVDLRIPREMGGEGGGTNPEELFAVGFAACFEGAIGVMGRRERAEVGDVSIDSRVTLTPTEERRRGGRGRPDRRARAAGEVSAVQSVSILLPAGLSTYQPAPKALLPWP